MDTHTQPLRVYKDLADWYERNGQPPMRDRFLVLAADSALASGQPEEAEQIREQLLRGNRHHMLRPYASFAEAVEAPDVQTYLHDLRVNYPPEIAAALLDTVRADETAPPDQTPAHRPPPPEARPHPPEARAIPPTAPLIDLFARDPALSWADPVAGRPLGGRAAPPEPNNRPPEPPARPAPPPPAARQAPARPPEPKPEPARPRPSAQPERPAPIPTAAIPATYRRQPEPLPDEPVEEPDGWVGWALAAVTMAVALGWAALALLRPYW